MLSVKLWIYENHMWTAEWRIIWRKIIAVIYTTYAVGKRKPEKKFRLVRNSNPWPLRYRCSALPIKLTDECTMVNPFVAGSLVLFTFRPYLWKGVQESFQVKWLLKFLSMSWKISFLKSHSKNLEASSFNEIKWIGFYRLIIKAAFLHGPECWLFQ